MYNNDTSFGKSNISLNQLSNLIKASTDDIAQNMMVKFLDIESSANSLLHYMQPLHKGNAFVRQCAKALARDFYDEEFAACNPTKTLDDYSNEVVRFTSSDFILEYTFHEESESYLFDAWVVKTPVCCNKKPEYEVSSERFTLADFYAEHSLETVSQDIRDYLIIIERTNDYFEE